AACAVGFVPRNLFPMHGAANQKNGHKERLTPYNRRGGQKSKGNSFFSNFSHGLTCDPNRRPGNAKGGRDPPEAARRRVDRVPLSWCRGASAPLQHPSPPPPRFGEGAGRGASTSCSRSLPQPRQFLQQPPVFQAVLLGH